MNLLKKLGTAASAALVFTSLTAGIAAAQEAVPVDVYFPHIQFEFDGKLMSPPDNQQGFLYQESTYVPLRFVAYSLDKAVDWDSDTYTVTIREPKKNELVSINEYKMNRVQAGVEKEKVDLSKLTVTPIPAYFEHVNYVFDGEVKAPPADLPGLLYEDVLYVPMRFVSESIGKEISWDEETYTVQAVTKPTEEPSKVPVSTQPQVPVGGGGGGSGVVTTPTYESIIAQTDSKISALKSEAINSLTPLFLQYISASSEEAKAALRSQGQTEIARIDSVFDSYMSQLEAALSNGNYDTSIVQTYKAQYQAEKDAQLNGLRK